MEWTPPFHGVTLRQEDTHAVRGQGIRGTVDQVDENVVAWPSDPGCQRPAVDD